MRTVVVLWILAILLWGVGDILTTYLILRIDPAGEGNPLMSFIINSWGIWWSAVVTKIGGIAIIWGFLALVKALRTSRLAPSIFITLGTIATLNNSIIIYLIY